MIYHIIAFVCGFLIDLILGDPYCFPHPIRLIGKLISWLERHLRTGKHDRRNGSILVVLVLVATTGVTVFLLALSYRIHPYLGVLVETIMTYQILATKCLRVESMKVYHSLKYEGLEEARKSVSMIVGRDTQNLSEAGVAKAAIETVAENTSDGVIAPMIYTAIFGPILGFFYKAVNTMDSMIGYKNEKYNHANPNSAQTESVCAGALGIRLAGDASYFGKLVKKPYIGDACREVSPEDIRRVNRLMYLTAGICEAVCLGILILSAVFC